jgi:hypothetical protein
MARRGDEIISIVPAGQPANEAEAAQRLAHQRATEVRLPDPAAGLPFRNAMIEFGDQPTVSAYRLLGLQETVGRDSLGMPADEKRVAELTLLLRTLVFDQIRRLRYGHERATAFMPGSLKAVPVPPEWWEGASVDRVANTATANGTTLAGLLIFSDDEYPPVVAEAPVAPEPPEAPPASLPKVRGRQPDKRLRVENAMRADIANPAKKCTVASLQALKGKELAAKYSTTEDTVSIYTANEALKAVAKTPPAPPAP